MLAWLYTLKWPSFASSNIFIGYVVGFTFGVPLTIVTRILKVCPEQIRGIIRLYLFAVSIFDDIVLVRIAVQLRRTRTKILKPLKATHALNNGVEPRDSPLSRDRYRTGRLFVLIFTQWWGLDNVLSHCSRRKHVIQTSTRVKMYIYRDSCRSMKSIPRVDVGTRVAL
jgi:hypothetical protein